MKEKSALILLLTLYAFTIFGHELAEEPFEWFVKNYSNLMLKNILNVVFVIGLLGFVVFYFRKLRNHPHRKTLIIYGIITIFFSVLCYRYLMPYKSEGIHFLQFGLLGFVCMMWVPNIWFSLNMVAFMGILDEIYQYINSNSTYLDFNDMVLNFFGVALGVIFYRLLFLSSSKIISGWEKNLGFILQVTFVLCLLIFLYTDCISVYAGEGAGRSIIRAGIPPAPEGFFRSVDFGPDWHRVKHYEGMAYVLIMPLLYLPMSKVMDK
jgi:glycopeptide antibiotics resistance protein